MIWKQAMWNLFLQNKRRQFISLKTEKGDTKSGCTRLCIIIDHIVNNKFQMTMIEIRPQAGLPAQGYAPYFL